MQIRSVKSITALESAYKFIEKTLQLSADHPRNFDYYRQQFLIYPNLLLIATEKDILLGVLLAIVENEHILVGELAVSPKARGHGLGSKLLNAIEKEAKSMGFAKILAGAREEAEHFYLKCDYLPKLFLQVQGKTATKKLNRFLSALPGSYKISWRNDEADTSKVIIETGKLDKGLQKLAEQQLPCHTQYLVSKEI